MYNLRYGNLKKNDEDVYNAAKLANLHDSIIRWPAGYETQVRDEGNYFFKKFL